MNVWARLLCAMVVGWAVLACGPKEASSSRPVVVASIPPIAMIAQELVPSGVEVSVLLPPGSSPHAFELSPGDAAKLEDSGLVLLAGGDIDPWAKVGKAHWSLFDAAPREEGIDPHLWLDPVVVREALPSLTQALADAFPKDAKTIQERAGVFAERLASLDKELDRQFEPAKGTNVVAFHTSFVHMFKRYGIGVSGVVEESPGDEPSASDMARLVDRAKAEGVKAVLTEPQLNESSAQVLAKEIGAKTILTDPLGGMPGRTTYEELLQWNARQLIEGLD